MLAQDKEPYKPKVHVMNDSHLKMTDEELKKRDEMMIKAFEKAFSEDEEGEVKPK